MSDACASCEHKKNEHADGRYGSTGCNAVVAGGNCSCEAFTNTSKLPRTCADCGHPTLAHTRGDGKLWCERCGACPGLRFQGMTTRASGALVLQGNSAIDFGAPATSRMSWDLPAPAQAGVLEFEDDKKP